MNPRDARRLDRVLKQLERPPRRRLSLISMAPISLALGLLVSHRLLVCFVPLVWNATLPGGFERALLLGDAPRLLARAAWGVHQQAASAALVLGGIAAAGFVASAVLRPLRVLVWLAAVCVLLLDAGILLITLKTALAATVLDAGQG